MPCWPLFRPKWGGSVEFRPVFYCVAFLTILFLFFGSRDRWGTPFLAPKSDGVPHFWSIFAPKMVPTWRHLGPLWCKSWFWMGWWGYAKRREFFGRNCRPTCLLELTFQKGNYLKKMKIFQRNTSKSSSILGPGADVAVGT